MFIHTTFLGGGYGGGGGSDQIRQAVAVAKTLNGRPVKLLWTREEDMRLGEKYRPMGIGRFEAALDADGWPLAITMRTTSDRYDRNVTPAGTYKNHGRRAGGARPPRAAVLISRCAITTSTPATATFRSDSGVRPAAA